MKDRFSAVEQQLGQKIWTIVTLFYRSHAAFKELFERYEKKVGGYSQVLGLPRDNLRLNSRELASLLDLKSMERIRDGYIQDLKDLCHLVFRGQDQTDLLDRYVSDIFHEISILKEEHYNVITYAPLYERDAAEVELKHILDEAHTLFPQKLQHIRYLFGRAQARLEDHLDGFSGIQLFIRSLYIHRDDFVSEAYEGGIEHFYRLMYPLGPFEGYYEVGRSFYLSGFFDHARQAFAEAEHAYRQLLLVPAGSNAGNGAGGAGIAGNAHGGEPHARPRQLYQTLRCMRSKIRQLERSHPEHGVLGAAAEVRA